MTCRLDRGADDRALAHLLAAHSIATPKQAKEPIQPHVTKDNFLKYMKGLKLEVGLVKYIFQRQGIIVGCYPKQEIHFDSLDLNHKDIVIFNYDYDKKLISNVGLASEHDFNSNQLSIYSSIELALVRLINKNLDQFLISKKLAGRDLLIRDLDNHINSTDISRLAEEFSVYISEWHHNKAGDDDSISISFSSTGNGFRRQV